MKSDKNYEEQTRIYVCTDFDPSVMAFCIVKNNSIISLWYMGDHFFNSLTASFSRFVNLPQSRFITLDLFSQSWCYKRTYLLSNLGPTVAVKRKGEFISVGAFLPSGTQGARIINEDLDALTNISIDFPGVFIFSVCPLSD